MALFLFNHLKALLQRLLKNEYFGLEDLSGMCYLLGSLLFKFPEKFLTYKYSTLAGIKLL